MTGITVLRETPKAAARARLEGSRYPVARRPSAISDLIRSVRRRVSEPGSVRDMSSKAGRRSPAIGTNVIYLHRSAVPLEVADLSTAADRGQLDLFGNECEGLCGV